MYADETTASPRHLEQNRTTSGFEKILKAKLSYQPSSLLSTSSSSSSSVLYAADMISPTRTPSLNDADASVFLPKSTPYEHSFASRLYGSGGTPGLRNDTAPGEKTLLFRDWENRPDWVEVLEDIHAHYILKQ